MIMKREGFIYKDSLYFKLKPRISYWSKTLFIYLNVANLF
jgi:hypothetical protein